MGREVRQRRGEERKPVTSLRRSRRALPSAASFDVLLWFPPLWTSTLRTVRTELGHIRASERTLPVGGREAARARYRAVLRGPHRGTLDNSRS